MLWSELHVYPLGVLTIGPSGTPSAPFSDSGNLAGDARGRQQRQVRASAAVEAGRAPPSLFLSHLHQDRGV
eukprot:scaffold5154_cov124-Pinguiococcus_pyrenoidosus.AAC.1